MSASATCWTGCLKDECPVAKRALLTQPTAILSRLNLHPSVPATYSLRSVRTVIRELPGHCRLKLLGDAFPGLCLHVCNKGVNRILNSFRCKFRDDEAHKRCLDPSFLEALRCRDRNLKVVTTGFISGPILSVNHCNSAAGWTGSQFGQSKISLGCNRSNYSMHT